MIMMFLTGPWVGLKNFSAYSTLDPEEETGAESSSSCGIRWFRTDNKNIIVAVKLYRQRPPETNEVEKVIFVSKNTC